MFDQPAVWSLYFAFRIPFPPKKNKIPFPSTRRTYFRKKKHRLSKGILFQYFVFWKVPTISPQVQRSAIFGGNLARNLRPFGFQRCMVRLHFLRITIWGCEVFNKSIEIYPFIIACVYRERETIFAWILWILPSIYLERHPTVQIFTSKQCQQRLCEAYCDVLWVAHVKVPTWILQGSEFSAP